jgi:signal peptidase
MTVVDASGRAWLRRLLWVAVAMAALALAAPVVSGEYQLHPVLTGSMRPGFALGSVVVVKRVPVQSVAVRDVILFHKPGHPSEYVVHRVIDISNKSGQRVIETKGDNNPVKDPWHVALAGRFAYRAQFTIPFLGYAALYAHRPQTRRLALYLAAALMVLAAVSAMRSKGESADKERHDDAGAAPAQRDDSDAATGGGIQALRSGGRSGLRSPSEQRAAGVDGGRW